MCHLWWTKWQWGKLLLENFGLHCKSTFHHALHSFTYYLSSWPITGCSTEQLSHLTPIIRCISWYWMLWIICLKLKLSSPMRKEQPTGQENGPHSYWENSSKDKGPNTLLWTVWSTAYHFNEWVINAYLLHQGDFHQHAAGIQQDFKIPKLTAFTCYATIFTFNTSFGQIHNSKQYCCTLGNLPKSHICSWWACVIFHFVIRVSANTILQSISRNENLQTYYVSVENNGY